VTCPLRVRLRGPQLVSRPEPVLRRGQDGREVRRPFVFATFGTVGGPLEKHSSFMTIPVLGGYHRPSRKNTPDTNIFASSLWENGCSARYYS
jgi:hypothetical protein